MCVSELQVKDIVHKEMKPIRKEFGSAKNWAISLLIGLIATMFGIGTWVGTIENRVENNTFNQQKFEIRFENRLERIENLLIDLSKK